MKNAFSILKKLLPKTKTKKQEQEKHPQTKEKQSNISSLSQRVDYIKEKLGYDTNDVVIRQFSSSNNKVHFAVLYIDGMADKQTINDNIIRPAQSDIISNFAHKLTPQNALSLLQEHITSGSEIAVVPDIDQAISLVLGGDTALLIGGENKILVYGTRSFAQRAVQEPETEAAVRGPREGFTETLRTNTSMLRRRISHPDLRLESFFVGRYTQTEVVIAYIHSIANEHLLQEVRRRIASIDTDSILDSSYIEEFIEDNPYSFFPQIEHTERADKAAAAALDGRVVIIVNNTPFVLIVPTNFFQFLQAAEDYYERPYIGTFLRLLRLFLLNIALMLPAVYVAVTTFHQEMLPTALLLSVAAAREGIPLPAVGEALIMETTFEILREAGTKLPKTVGQAISIVGGLVIGDAAIRAGIVSPAMVIVVATTAISTFAIPAFNASIALRLLRFPLIILGAIMGLYGVLWGLVFILIHLCSLQSFGVPYLSPLVHGSAGDMAESFVRPHWRFMLRRPSLLAVKNKQRQPGISPPEAAPAAERELTHENTEE